MATEVKRRFTCVDWWDPSDKADGWISKDDTRKIADAELVTTYGEIIDEDDVHLKLAFNFCGKDGYVNTTGLVIKSSIARRRDYKFPWKSTPKRPEPKS